MCVCGGGGGGEGEWENNGVNHEEGNHVRPPTLGSCVVCLAAHAQLCTGH